MARLTIPERQKGPLKRLIALSDGDVAQLRDALEKTPPAQNYQALAARLASRVELGSEAVLELAGLLLSLAQSAYRAGISLQEAAADAVAAAIDAALVQTTASEALKSRLVGLLTVKAVSVSAKAAWLATQHEHVFVDCTTYTDIRSVFTSEGDEGRPSVHSAVVVHNLEIEFHEGPEHKSQFFALDGNDLRTLRGAVERAIQKEEELRKVIEKAGLNYIPVG